MVVVAAPTAAATAAAAAAMRSWRCVVAANWRRAQEVVDGSAPSDRELAPVLVRTRASAAAKACACGVEGEAGDEATVGLQTERFRC